MIFRSRTSRWDFRGPCEWCIQLLLRDARLFSFVKTNDVAANLSMYGFFTSMDSMHNYGFADILKRYFNCLFVVTYCMSCHVCRFALLLPWRDEIFATSEWVKKAYIEGTYFVFFLFLEMKQHPCLRYTFFLFGDDVVKMVSYLFFLFCFYSPREWSEVK